MRDALSLPTRSIGLKFLLVCALVVLMAAPTFAVWGVLSDRLNRFQQVRAELSRYEGGEQRLLGPVLLVPYAKEAVVDGRVTTVQGEAVAFAETGTAAATLAMDVRRRDIYAVPVYRASTRLAATFNPAAILTALQEQDPQARFDLSKARVAVGLSNTVGVLEPVRITPVKDAPARELTPVVGVGDQDGAFRQIAAPVGDLAGAGQPFSIDLTMAISGAERFAIAPFAKNTTATIAGDWADPSFEGGFLPTQRAIDKQRFQASWSAPLARRGVAAAATDRGVLSQIADKDFAVRFVEPTNIYTGVDRALKYGLMFIGLVFLTYFMIEVASGLKAHPAQYVMVGVAQAVFYLLLLAFAERMGFDVAFAVAATMTVGLLSSYAAAVFRGGRYFWISGATFAGLYGLMYVLLRLDDYALVVGATASFAAVAALMYVTRNVEWYPRAAGAGQGAR